MKTINPYHVESQRFSTKTAQRNTEQRSQQTHSPHFKGLNTPSPWWVAKDIDEVFKSSKNDGDACLQLARLAIKYAGYDQDKRGAIFLSITPENNAGKQRRKTTQEKKP